MTSSSPTLATTAAAPRLVTRWLIGIVLVGVALALVVTFAPVSLVVAGLFGMAVAVRHRPLPWPVRVALFVVGLAVTVTSGLALADFAGGTTQLTT